MLNTNPPYQLGRQIGSGSFARVHVVVSEIGEECAAKLEDASVKISRLKHELKMLKLLQGHHGIPKIYSFNFDGDQRVLVMELYGQTLEEFFQHSRRKFSLKTTAGVAFQILTLIEYVHSKGITHRDIKPQNFVFGLNGRSAILHIIDFGLARNYCDPKTKQHIPYREKKPLAGTMRYASINAHIGVEMSRRDDLEAIGYLLVYLSLGRLPWQGIKGPKDERYKHVMEMKVQTPVDVLCKDCAAEFATHLSYSRALQFEDLPDYEFLSHLFADLYEKQKLVGDQPGLDFILPS